MYTEHFEVCSHEVDPDNIIRPSSLLRLMQEAANHQMRDAKPSYTDLFEEGKAFLLSRIAIKSYAPLHQYDKIKVSNWPVEGKGATFPRCYRVQRDGELIAQGQSAWALVDTNTHRLYRVNEILFPNFTYGPLESVDGMRFRLPDAMDAVGTHTVVYHETDLNGHMNNGNYPDLLLDHTPERQTHYMADFSIHFVAEAPLDERLTILRSQPQSIEEGGLRYFFCTQRSDGSVNIEAQVTLKPKA